MECICCGIEIVKVRRVNNLNDLVCDSCRANGEMLFEESHIGTCETCDKSEVYYGPPAAYVYICRECSGHTDMKDQLESLRYWDEYFHNLWNGQPSSGRWPLPV